MKAIKQLVFPWLFTLGLIGAALMLIFVVGSPSSVSGMPSQYSYNLPAIKSRCLHYLCSMWSLLVRKEEAPVMTSRNLFLLVNLIIFLILGSMHLQHHAAASAARKARKMSRTSNKEKLEIFRVDSPQPLHKSLLSSCIEKEEDAAAATMPSDACVTTPDRACMETSSDGFSAGAISVVQVDPQAVEEKLSPIEEPNTAGSASVKIWAAQYPGSPAAVAANDSEPACGALDQDGRPTATVERIILEEDGRLQWMEMQGAGDAQKNEDGLLGCVERPLPTASRRKQVRGQRRPEPQSSDANYSNASYITNSSKDNHTSSGRENPSSNGHTVPKSMSLNSNDLLLSDHQKVQKSSVARSRVKSMDASDISRKKRGKKNVVKRAFGLRREPSITSQEELNARVESFIAKFNENIKIQRQQSLLSYMQMVDRGAN